MEYVCSQTQVAKLVLKVRRPAMIMLDLELIIGKGVGIHQS